MSKREITIIEAPTNLGLKDLTPGKPPGVHLLPAWMKALGFYEQVKHTSVLKVPSPAYVSAIDPGSGIRNANEVRAYSKKLSETIHQTVSQEKFALVIGGDCSILLGSGLALKKLGRYGLFFIDGHTDFVATEMSNTKAAAGMDLAIVTGNGHDKLSDIDHLKPYFAEVDTLAFGNRYLEKNYVSLITHSSVEYIDLQKGRTAGITNIAGSFITKMKTNNCKGFWIHLDVDVLDDLLMPCVDSRQEGGLQYAELVLLLQLLTASDLCAGLEITILDPDLDPKGKYTRQFIHEIAPVISAIAS